MRESEVFEFKKNLASIDEIIQTVVAFKNTHGGDVLVGINDNGEVIGLSIGENTIENLAKEITNSTSPKVYPRIQEEKIAEKNIIRISIEEGKKETLFF